MKIIGKTEKGYLVEATGLELRHAAGYDDHDDHPAQQEPRWNHKFPIGTVFDVSAGFYYLKKLRENEQKMKDCETILAAAAILIGKTTPMTYIPPDENEASP